LMREGEMDPGHKARDDSGVRGAIRLRALRSAFRRCRALARLACFGRGTLLRFLLGRALLRTIGLGELHEIALGEDTRQTLRRLSTMAEPMLHALGIEFDAIGTVFWQQRIVVADALDEATITGCGGLGHDDAIEGPLFRAAARQTNFQRHPV